MKKKSDQRIIFLSLNIGTKRQRGALTLGFKTSYFPYIGTILHNCGGNYYIFLGLFVHYHEE